VGRPGAARSTWAW